MCFLVMSSNYLIAMYRRFEDVFKKNDEVISCHGFNILSLFMMVPILLDLFIDAFSTRTGFYLCL